MTTTPPHHMANNRKELFYEQMIRPQSRAMSYKNEID